MILVLCSTSFTTLFAVTSFSTGWKFKVAPKSLLKATLNFEESNDSEKLLGKWKEFEHFYRINAATKKFASRIKLFEVNISTIHITVF